MNINALENKFESKFTFSSLKNEDSSNYSHNFNNLVKETETKDIKKIYKIKDKEDRATVE